MHNPTPLDRVNQLARSRSIRAEILIQPTTSEGFIRYAFSTEGDAICLECLKTSPEIQLEAQSLNAEPEAFPCGSCDGPILGYSGNAHIGRTLKW